MQFYNHRLFLDYAIKSGRYANKHLFTLRPHELDTDDDDDNDGNNGGEGDNDNHEFYGDCDGQDEAKQPKSQKFTCYCRN